MERMMEEMAKFFIDMTQVCVRQLREELDKNRVKEVNEWEHSKT